MKNIRKLLGVVLFLVFIFNIMPFSFAEDMDLKESKKILILHSYHKDYPWTDSIERGIKDALLKSNIKIIFDVEYMDTKKNNDSLYFDELFRIYKKKFNELDYDIIMPTDNDALNFLVKYGQELFPKIPIVFSGINNFKDDMLKGKDNYTGVVEYVDFKETIDLSLELHPKAKQLIVINDKTTTGLENDKIIVDLIPQYRDKIDIIKIDDLSISGIKLFLQEIKSDSIILFIASYLHEDKKEYPLLDGLRDISKSTSFPIYSPWDLFINEGVVGGMATSGYRQGQLAGKQASRIIAGESIDNIPIVKEDFNNYIFDFKEIERFGIEEERLPLGSIIINRPSLYISEKLFYGILTSIIIILLTIICLLRDSIEERNKTERALRKSEERYRRLIELSPEGIIVYKLSGEIIYANSAIVKMAEADGVRDLLGKSVFHFVHENYRELTNNFIESIERDRSFIAPSSEQKVYTLKGNVLDVEVTAVSISYETDHDILAIVRDISERKRSERLLVEIEEEKRLLKEAIEYDTLKTEFFANLSHELRTPLNVILGVVELLRMDIMGSDEKQFDIYMKRVKTLKQNCYRLLRLVNNLIDITKIDTNYFELNLQNYNIISIVEDITLSVVSFVEQKNLRLIFDTDVEEKIVACDPDKIERIMLNLLSNAIKFTKPGGEIYVNIYDKDEYILISVKDTGIGIEEDKKKIVFDRFRQADKSFTRNHEGSGIGLSLVKSLVELHGGEITLESEYGKGSEFIIKIPVTTTKNHIVKAENTHKDYVELINIEFSDIYSS